MSEKNTKFYDKNGTEIQEFDLLKVYHFTGAKNKKHFMYKWVREKDGHLFGSHLSSKQFMKGSYPLKAVCDPEGRILHAEIVQSPQTLKKLYRGDSKKEAPNE